MKTPIEIISKTLAALALAGLFAAGSVLAETTISYQGHLEADGEPADETVDMSFELFDDPTGGSSVGGPIDVDGVEVAEGLFQVELDFGADTFDGQPRFLAIEVDGQPLEPRQRVASTPVAQFALEGNEGPEGPEGPEGASPFVLDGDDAYFDQGAVSLGTDGFLPSNPRLFVQAESDSPALRAEAIGDEPSLVIRHMAEPDSVQDVVDILRGGQGDPEPGMGARLNFRLQASNAAYGPRGTIDSVWVDPDINNSQADMIFSTTGSDGVEEVLRLTHDNRVLVAGSIASLDDGDPVQVDGSLVSGGSSNEANLTNAAVIGGVNNEATSPRSAAVAGAGNSASSAAVFMGGGLDNVANGFGSTIVGGQDNSSSANRTAIAGGTNNQVSPGSDDAFIGGGVDNEAGGESSGVVAGDGLTAGSNFSFAAAGSNNTVDGTSSVILGGFGVNVSGTTAGSIGGFENSVGGTNSVIAGGEGNSAGDNNSFIGGGINQTSSGENAFIAGGRDNRTEGDNSLAAGSGARALHDNSFVWSDGSTQDGIETSAENQFVVSAGGAVRFYSDAARNTGVELAPGGSGWLAVSDRDAKTGIEEIDPVDVLNRVTELSVSEYSYKSQDTDIRHMGPMAQDFEDLFGLGEDELRISAMNLTGIALAAIQGLNERVDAGLAENAKLRAELEAERSDNEELRDKVAALSDQVAANSELAERNAELEGRLAQLEDLLLEGREVAERQQ